MLTRIAGFWQASTRNGDFWTVESPWGSESLLGVGQDGVDGVVLVLAHLGDVAGREDAAMGRVHDVGVELVVRAVDDHAHPVEVG